MCKKISLLFAIALFSALCRADFKDPTKPNYAPSTAVIKEDTATAADKLVLSAIWITASAKRATINGVTAKQGQNVLNNVKIISITRNTVVLNHNGSIVTLRLLQSPYKTK
ncbi:MAG: hypothetical protein Q8Q54_04725 [Methylococcales bacterium]|nr:hypothetical protein [Methylococcales bacterium]MDP3838207.1 hypothetical protein [Methylococcales bacterium]